MLCISDLTIFFPVIVVHPSLLSHSISLYDYITLSLYILLWMRSAVIVVLCHFIFKFLKLNIFERQRVGDWSKEMGIESEREKEREVERGRERNSHPPILWFTFHVPSRTGTGLKQKLECDNSGFHVGDMNPVTHSCLPGSTLAGSWKSGANLDVELRNSNVRCCHLVGLNSCPLICDFW